MSECREGEDDGSGETLPGNTACRDRYHGPDRRKSFIRLLQLAIPLVQLAVPLAALTHELLKTPGRS